MAGGTGNLILKRGTSIPKNIVSDGEATLLKGMPAVQLVGLSRVVDTSGTLGGPLVYAFDNYPNRLWVGMDNFGTGTPESNSGTGGGVTPGSMGGGNIFTGSDQEDSDPTRTRGLWMGAEIRAAQAVYVSGSNGIDAVPTILQADWANPSDVVLVTQKAIKDYVGTLGSLVIADIGSKSNTMYPMMVDGIGAQTVYIDSATTPFSYAPSSNTLTVSGDLAVNGGDITTTNTGTSTIFNTNTTRVDIGGAATDMRIGNLASTGSVRVGQTLVGNTTTQNVFDTGATTVNAFGAANVGLNLGYDGNLSSTTNIVVGDVTSVSTKTINIGTGVTEGGVSITVGSSGAGTASLVTVGGLLTVTENLAVNGASNTADITTTNTVAKVFNSTATTVNIGGAATTLTIGAATGTTTINNANTVVTGDLSIGGGSAPKSIKFLEASGNGTNFVAFKAPSLITTSRTYILPDDFPDANKVLQSDTSGNLTWVSAGNASTVSIGSSGDSIEYGVVLATTGSKGGNASLVMDNGDNITYNPSTDTLTVPNLIVNGTTTTIDTTNLLVEDANIIIGNTASPSDTTGNGGGITLKSNSDRTITWDKDINPGGTTTGTWKVNTNFSIPDGGGYLFAADKVLGKTFLSLFNSGTGGGSFTIKAPTTTSPTDLASGLGMRLPSTVASSGQILRVASMSSNEAQLEWATPSAGVAGSNTQVMFNNNGSLAGDAGFTYDLNSDSVTLAGDIAVNGGDITTTAATLSIGNTSTSSNTTTNISNAAISSGVSKTVNIGTNSSTSSTTVINIGTGWNQITAGTINLGTFGATGIVANMPIRYTGNSGSNYVQLQAPQSTSFSNYTLTFPTTSPSNGQLLSSDSSGNLSWTTQSNITAGSVNVRLETGVFDSTTPRRYNIPFLGSNGQDNPSVLSGLSEGTATAAYLYVDSTTFNIQADTSGNYTNRVSGLYYEIDDTTGSPYVGTLYCDYIGAMLDCGTY
jgi:hypothetical protein